MKPTDPTKTPEIDAEKIDWKALNKRLRDGGIEGARVEQTPDRDEITKVKGEVRKRLVRPGFAERFRVVREQGEKLLAVANSPDEAVGRALFLWGKQR